MTDFNFTIDMYERIHSSDDKDARIEAFALAFGTTPDTVRDKYIAMAKANERKDGIAALNARLATYSIPKTVKAHALAAAGFGCTLTVKVQGEDISIVVNDPTAISRGRKGKSSRRYFVDGAPLFDSYKSIMDAMRQLGGFDTVIAAVGPGNAHKVDSTRWGPKTSLNAWQALMALGTDSQKARITRTG